MFMLTLGHCALSLCINHDPFPNLVTPAAPSVVKFRDLREWNCQLSVKLCIDINVCSAVILPASSVWWTVCTVSNLDISICSPWNHSSLAPLNSCENSPSLNHSFSARVEDQLCTPASEPKACAAVQPLHPHCTQAIRATKSPLFVSAWGHGDGKVKRVIFGFFFLILSFKTKYYVLKCEEMAK